MMDALDCGIDVEDYPRVMYESTRILKNVEGEQQQADTAHMEGGEHHLSKEDTHPHGREGRPSGRSKSRSKQPRHEGRSNTATGEDEAKDGNGEERQYHDSPRPRRRNPDAPGGGG